MAIDDRAVAAQNKPNTLVLVSIAVGHLTAVTLTWRDLHSRDAALVRGSKTVWRALSAANTLGSAAYWLV